MSVSIEKIIIVKPEDRSNLYSVDAEIVRNDQGHILSTTYISEPVLVEPNPPLVPEVEAPKVEPVLEPVKLNVHKYILEKLLVGKTQEQAAVILAFFISNAKTQYLLSLGEIEVAPYIDLIIGLFGLEEMDDSLRAEILAILGELKGSI